MVPVFLCLGAQAFAAARARTQRAEALVGRWVFAGTRPTDVHESAAFQRAIAASGAVVCTSISQSAALAAVLSTLPPMVGSRRVLRTVDLPLPASFVLDLPTSWDMDTADHDAFTADLYLHSANGGRVDSRTRATAAPALVVNPDALEPARADRGEDPIVWLDTQTLRLVLHSLASGPASKVSSSAALHALPTTLAFQARPKRFLAPEEDLILCATALGWPVELRRTDHAQVWVARDGLELEEAEAALLGDVHADGMWQWEVRKCLPEHASLQTYHAVSPIGGGVVITRTLPGDPVSWYLPLSDHEASGLAPATVVILQRLGREWAPSPGATRTFHLWLSGGIVWWEEESP